MTPGKNSFLRGLFLETSVMSGGDVLFLWLVFSSRATACLNCFSTAAQRLRICQYFWGYQSEKHQTCLGTLESAFRPLSKTQVDVSEIEKLKDAFGRVVFYLEEKGMAKAPFQEAVPEAVNEVEKEIAQLKAAPPCIPPCGYQKESHYYRCSSCSIMDCQLPIDCPRYTQIGRRRNFSELRSRLPDFLRQDLPVEICQRLTEKRLGNEKKLQEMFKAILNSPPESVQEAVVVNKLPSLQDLMSQPDYLRKRGVIVLILGITGISLLVTLAVLSLYRWATDFGP
ncbi:sperm acrosome membrane-associated protein 6 isoform X6 [Pantherophis guttatus]|uniref:Sperm acrosome membrane-associated protein 6 isoform X6 n=1 Tax=Pantherophis guttatus TaxID=94885 RepID=A0A6P9DHR3_PANGU|nr:sperm acrosome membrane-associated protein 6 isoform X6 [Pantherophis guttatus]